jgi:large subunit ribosomal protein L28
MARVCQITGKRTQVGNNVSHANNRTLRKFYPNLQTKKFFLESENRTITLKVSARAIRTINKIGLEAALKDAQLKGYLSKIK